MKTVFILFTLASIFSCQKEVISDVPPHIPETYERFVGTYDVYDTASIYLYTMNIRYNRDTNLLGGHENVLEFENYNDMFDFRFFFNQQADMNHLLYPVQDSISDYDGHTWYLSNKLNFPETEYQENTLRSDTFFICFELSNIQYYINEAQPYYHCICKQWAVKR